MKLTMVLICVAAMVLFLGGCASEIAQVDLNGDSRVDVVSGLNAESHFYYFDYKMAVELSMPDGTYQKKPLVQFRGRPDRVWFEDSDRDGDLDLRCELISKSRWDQVSDGEYVSLNDGNGNFGELKRLEDAARRQVRPALTGVNYSRESSPITAR